MATPAVGVASHISPPPSDDESRVVLEEVPGEEGSDYINACWIDVSPPLISMLCQHNCSSSVTPQGYRHSSAYIAAQGTAIPFKDRSRTLSPSLSLLLLPLYLSPSLPLTSPLSPLSPPSLPSPPPSLAQDPHPTQQETSGGWCGSTEWSIL